MQRNELELRFVKLLVFSYISIKIECLIACTTVTRSKVVFNKCFAKDLYN